MRKCNAKFSLNIIFTKSRNNKNINKNFKNVLRHKERNNDNTEFLDLRQIQL